MKLQLLSDLHLETEAFDPEPADGAELLVLGGDIDSTWAGLDKFRGWPVPVIFVAGNHEFDGRELTTAWRALRDRCEQLDFTMLERQSIVLTDAQDRRIRFVATTRWCDFDLFGSSPGTPQHDRVLRAASYFMRIMHTTRNGLPFDAAAVREEALACRAWLAAELAKQPDAAADGWDSTVAITHFGPSLRSADPRYGGQPGTASFCNADDDLLPLAQVWIHGHLHCRHNYSVEHAQGTTRVVCNARGHGHKRESAGYDGRFTVDA